MQALLWDDEPSKRPTDSEDFLLRTCVTCRSDAIEHIGTDLRKCRDCSAVMAKNAGTGEWQRLAAIFGGRGLTRPKRRKAR